MLELRALICLAPLLLASSALEAKERFGDWYFSSNVDQLTRERREYIYTLPESTSRNGSEQISLAFHCKPSAGFLAAISWKSYASSGREVKMSYRIDDEEVVTRNWYVSKDGKFVKYPGKGRFLARKLYQKSKIIVRVFPQYSNSITATFSLYGFPDAISQMEACITGYDR